MHLLNVLKQLGIATAVALTIGMVIGPSQVVARVAEFSIGRNLHPTSSARAGVLLCLIGLGLLISGLPWLAFVAIALYGQILGLKDMAYVWDCLQGRLLSHKLAARSPQLSFWSGMVRR